MNAKHGHSMTYTDESGDTSNVLSFRHSHDGGDMPHHHMETSQTEKPEDKTPPKKPVAGMRLWEARLHSIAKDL